MALSKAKEAVSQYIGRHGIYAVRGNDRVIVYTNKPISSQVENTLCQAAEPHRVDIIEKDEASVPTAAPQQIIPTLEDQAKVVDVAPKPKIEKPSKTKTTTATEDTSINARGKWGYTQLHFAAVAGDVAECENLLKQGAKKTIKDNSGQLPWQKALNAGFEELAEKLKP